MDQTTIEAFIDELSSFDKTAGIKDLVKKVVKPMKTGEKLVGDASRQVFKRAANVVGSDAAHQAALKGTEILHKLYT